MDLSANRYRASLDRDASLSAGAVIGLDELNQLASPQFVATLEGIFEHSPWIAERAAVRRPFGSRLQLLDAMRAVVDAATPVEQLALINAHPKLGARGRPRQQLTQASSREQRRAGLDACSDEEFAHLERVNADYTASFGFPFILAVRGHDPGSIIAQMERRLRHDPAQEIRTALREIALIAGYRLADVVASSAAAEIRAMLERLPETGVELACEWMRAAGLSVWSDGGECTIGILSGSAAAGSGITPGTVLIGALFDSASQTLQYSGQGGWVSGIAVAQQLKQQDIRLAFELAICALPLDQSGWDPSDLATVDSSSVGRSIDSIDRADANSGAVLAALRAAGLKRVFVPLADRGAAGESQQQPERAARALLEFLTHT
jgi:N-carbamoyl-L-amino-acid hydrolase